MLADHLPLLHLTPHVNSGHVTFHEISDSKVCLFCRKVQDLVFSPFSYLKLIVMAQVLTQLLFVERAVMLMQEGCNGFWGSFHRT